VAANLPRRALYFTLALLIYMLAIVVNGGWQVPLRAGRPFVAVLRFIFTGFFFNNSAGERRRDVMRMGLARYTDR
jgi:hypothetical protein